MRAYHRVDPLMDERKSHYTPAQFGAYTKIQLMAGRTGEPGVFRSLAALKRALPADYAVHVPFLVAEGDIIIRDDQAAVIDGWREWQEGDLTVGERMKRLRERKRNESPPPVTANVTDGNDKPIRSETSPAAIGVGVGVGVDTSSLSTEANVPKQRARDDAEPRVQRRPMTRIGG